MSALFRVRKSLFGKCILQKYSGDIYKGPPPGFSDIPWQPNIGVFTLVPTRHFDELQQRVAAAEARVAVAEKRAEQQRTARKAKRDFEASQFADSRQEDHP